MKVIGKLYINGRLSQTIYTDKVLRVVSLKKFDLVDIINETGRTSDELLIEEPGLYHFGIKKDGTVFLIKGWF